MGVNLLVVRIINLLNVLCIWERVGVGCHFFKEFYSLAFISINKLLQPVKKKKKKKKETPKDLLVPQAHY